MVGAGPNGLVAANVLADRGWSVLVLEEQPHPGGAAVSTMTLAPGFVSDLYSAFYPLAAVSPVLPRLELHRHGLRWAHAPEVLAHVLPDDRAVVLSHDVRRTAASVEQFAPGDGRRWAELAAWWQLSGDALVRALLGPFPPVRPALRLARSLGPAGTLHLARLAVLSVRRLAEERFGGTAPLRGGGADDDGRPHPFAGGHRVALGVPAPAAPSCGSSSSSGPRPGSAVPKPSSTGCSWPAPPRTRAGACTGCRATTPPGPRYSVTAGAAPWSAAAW